jgi:hypothetical protein
MALARSVLIVASLTLSSLERGDHYQAHLKAFGMVTSPEGLQELWASRALMASLASLAWEIVECNWTAAVAPGHLTMAVDVDNCRVEKIRRGNSLG